MDRPPIPKPRRRKPPDTATRQLNTSVHSELNYSIPVHNESTNSSSSVKAPPPPQHSETTNTTPKQSAPIDALVKGSLVVRRNKLKFILDCSLAPCISGIALIEPCMLTYVSCLFDVHVWVILVNNKRGIMSRISSSSSSFSLETKLPRSLSFSDRCWAWYNVS